MPTSLESWSNARSSFIFTDDALRKGRAKAVAVWNTYPTDLTVMVSGTMPVPAAGSAATGVNIPVPASGTLASTVMVEDAAYAFAFLDESLRMDSQKLLIKGSGVEGDPAQVLSSLTDLALQAVAEYTKWVSETKPLMVAGNLGL